MAPEQASGRPADQRADIYALGLILYEMLVGRRGSGGGDTALALLIERSRHAPPGLRTIDPTIPEPVERLVTKCLEPDPAARFQTTAELEAVLDLLDGSGNERHRPKPVEPVKRNGWMWIAAAIGTRRRRSVSAYGRCAARRSWRRSRRPRSGTRSRC